MSDVRPRVQALIDRGNVTAEEVEELHRDLWDGMLVPYDVLRRIKIIEAEFLAACAKADRSGS